MPNSIDIRLKNVKQGELIWFGLPDKGEEYYSSKIPEARKHLTFEFKQKLIKICNDININPNYLMACIALETGFTFLPSIQNHIGATGLIQFVKSTDIKILNRTTDHLASLSVVEQLDYVKEYLLKNRVRYAKSVGDLYLCIFTPSDVGKPDEYILYEEGNSGYDDNVGLDLNRDHNISKKEITTKINKILKEGLKYVG